MEALRTLRSKLEEYGLSQDVTRLEVADTEQLALLYQDRISVLLGTLNDLDYKLDRARYVLTNADGKGCGPHRHRAAGFQPYQRQQHTQDLFCTGRAHPALRLCGAAQG